MQFSPRCSLIQLKLSRIFSPNDARTCLKTIQLNELSRWPSNFHRWWNFLHFIFDSTLPPEQIRPGWPRRCRGSAWRRWRTSTSTLVRGSRRTRSAPAHLRIRWIEWDRSSAWTSAQTLQGSFLTVPKPIFASKYSLESSRRDLHNALFGTALQSHFFANLI